MENLIPIARVVLGMRRVTLAEFQDILDSSSEFTLSEDIYLEESLVDRIMSRFKKTGLTQFKLYGVLDGNGHTIHNVTSRLFKYIEGCVRNVTLQSSECISESPICEVNNGLIENVTVDLSVCTEQNWCGGLVSKNNGEIIESTFCGDCVTSGSDGEGCGGIADVNQGSLIDCSVSTDISGFKMSGGVVRKNFGDLKKCEFTGYIDSESKSGGISARNNGTITQCLVYESIIESGIEFSSEVGGICAVNKDEIYNATCQDVVLESGSIGGISSLNAGQISGCSFGGSIRGTGFCGGLCSRLIGIKAELKESWFAGDTIKSAEQSGGLCGRVSSAATCRNCYSETFELPDTDRNGFLFGKITDESSKSVTVENCYYNGNGESMDLVGSDQRGANLDKGVHQSDMTTEGIRSVLLVLE